MTSLPVNFQLPAYHENLYATYAELREQQPVYKDSIRNAWMITRYEDVKAVLRDTQRFKNSGTSQDFIPQLQATDGEQHKKVRSQVIGQFNKGLAESFGPVITGIVKSLFESLPGSGEKDILNDVIKELPRRFMSDFLGFPQHLRERWYALGEPLVGLDPHNVAEIPEDLFQQMIDVIEQATQWKREHRDKDFLSWLMQQEDEGLLTADEVLLFARNLGFAALDTTVNLLANGTALLARFPEQRELLIKQPGLLDNAIDEMLRYDAPTQALPRRLAADVTLHGVTMKKGEEASLVFGAANHDPEKYSNPEQFDITRKSFDHLAFGHGLHKCIGQYLARMEAQAYFTALLQYFPNYQVNSARWMISPWARAYAELLIE